VLCHCGQNRFVFQSKQGLIEPFQFNEASYQIPATISENDKLTLISGYVSTIDESLAKVSEARAIIAQAEAMKTVGEVVGGSEAARLKTTVYQEGVVITHQLCPLARSCFHQILNSEQFNGAGRKVFRQFVDEVVKPSCGDLYLSVRKENAVACRFYERHGMRVAGIVVWKKRTIPGMVLGYLYISDRGWRTCWSVTIFWR
jgi:hypothetical protein